MDTSRGLVLASLLWWSPSHPNIIIEHYLILLGVQVINRQSSIA